MRYAAGRVRSLSSRLTLVAVATVALAAPAFARVFTLRSGGSPLEDPSAFGGKSVYRGRFLVNGSPSALRIFQISEAPENAMRRVENALGNGLVWGRARGASVTGTWAQGNARKRLLLIPNGERGGSLLFVYEARDASFASPRWPSSLPGPSPAMEPSLVIEHPEAKLLFASASVESSSMDALLEACRADFEADGWQPFSGAESGGRRSAESGFALFTKKGKTCWMQARPGPSPQKVTVVFLLKSD